MPKPEGSQGIRKSGQKEVVPPGPSSGWEKFEPTYMTMEKAEANRKEGKKVDKPKRSSQPI